MDVSDSISAMNVVVMGVSGSGKSTIAEGIAEALGFAYVDGDDLHGEANVAKMASGTPLDDSDRWPWLDRIGETLATAGTAGGGLVVACSALKRAYRDRIRRAAPAARFVFLDGAAPLIRERMQRRKGHYMPTGLLDSQFAALERPAADEPHVLTIGIDAGIDQVVGDAVAALRKSWRSGGDPGGE